MSVYMVTYDLDAPGQDYGPLIKEIQAYTHCKCLKSAFFIDTAEDASTICTKLRKFIDQNDTLFVMELKKHWSCNRKTDCTAWLKNAARTWG